MVSLCLYAAGRMRGSDRAFDFMQEHAGVIVFGCAVEGKNSTKKRDILQLLFEKHTPPHLKVNVDYEPASQKEIDSASVFRIDIDDWSGKMKWTNVEAKFSFYHEDVCGERRAKFPWVENKWLVGSLTEEWKESDNRH